MIFSIYDLLLFPPSPIIIAQTLRGRTRRSRTRP